jgi:hypothetical protein
MTTYRRFQQRMIGVQVGAVLVTSIGCSTPLSTREKGALIGGGPGAGIGALMGGGTGAAIGGALGAGGGALIGDQMQQDREIMEPLARRAGHRPTRDSNKQEVMMCCIFSYGSTSPGGVSTGSVTW